LDSIGDNAIPNTNAIKAIPVFVFVFIDKGKLKLV
jgi:hypothetical protein